MMHDQISFPKNIAEIDFKASNACLPGLCMPVSFSCYAM